MLSPEHCYTAFMAVNQNKERKKKKKKDYVYELYSFHRNNIHMMAPFANSVYVAFSSLCNLRNLTLIQILGIINTKAI